MLKKFNKKLLISLFIFGLVAGFFGLIGIESVSAQASNILWGGQEGNVSNAIGLGNNDFRIVAAKIINVSLGFLGIIAVIIMVYAGWLWMTSGGSADKIDKAKKMLIGALIGLLIILSSWAIASYVVNNLWNATGGSGGGGTPCIFGDSAYPPISCNACGGTSVCQPSNFYGPCTPLCPPGPGPTYCSSTPSPLCTPDNTLCNPAIEFCNPASCFCSPLAGLGGSCNATTTPSVCLSDDTRCQAGLKCNNNPADTITDCTCYGAPVIDWISPDDGQMPPTPLGTAGNLMTIGGRFFGTSTGTVYLPDAGGNPTIAAPFPDSINAACTSYWTDNQIIIVVPAGVGDQTGPIKVVRPDFEFDDTANGRGATFNFYDDDHIVRPGVCQVSNTFAGSPCLGSDCGYFNDTFNLQGINFGPPPNRTIKLGNLVASSSVNNITWAGGNLSADATVPNVNPANTTIFAEVNYTSSNFISFQVKYNAASGPLISYISPSAGPPLQYITIYGSGFKSFLAGVSKVVFTDPATLASTTALVNFPPACLGSFWQDKQIIVKVPNVAVGPYDVTVTDRNNNISPPEPFAVNNNPLAPGLCKIQPYNGPVGTQVTADGERFGSGGNFSSAEFYNAVPGPINSWTVGQVRTSVPAGAQTGPFVINDDTLPLALSSNPLNFQVGACQNDSDCFAVDQCCPAGSYYEGICKAINTCNQAPSTNSAFGWTFSTSPSTITPLTCGGYVNASACIAAGTCPNSPGDCQSVTGQVVDSCGNADCANRYPSLCVGGCAYDIIKNKCVITGSTCDITDVNILPPYLATCRNINNQAVWQVDKVAGSCPVGSYMEISGGKCTVGTIGNPTTCNLCASGSTCVNSQCEVNGQVCPGGSKCDLPTNSCLKDSCTCCCQTSQDCCAGLTCQLGLCSSNNPAYGQCYGCRIENNGNPNDYSSSEQTLSDQACNCAGTSGKVCNVADPTDPADLGVCGDAPVGCNPLTEVACPTGSNPPLSGMCCPASSGCDPVNPNICAPPITCDLNLNNLCPDGLGGQVCCANPPGCNINIGVGCVGCAPTENLCGDGSCCQVACVDPGTGITTCPGTVGGRCVDIALPLTCTVGSPACPSPPYYACLNQNSADCRCCCNPGPSPQINAAGLTCVADKTPCSGGSRGLYCGCTADTQCEVGIPATVGCGSDTCCRPRPSVASTTPADMATGVCLNPLITATFDQPMNTASFESNIIVVGDYGIINQCPKGTQYLVLGGGPDKNIFVRIINKIKIFIAKLTGRLFGRASAYTPVSPASNFCAIPGIVDGYNDATGHGVLTFSPLIKFDPNQLYYAIIKGDANFDSQSGVLSSYNIGMAGPDTQTFSGVIYKNSKIWSFTTGAQICKLDYLTIDPPSYLFQTALDDTKLTPPLLDDDAYPSAGFDTAYDRDKAFYAFAKTSDGQSLASIPGLYEWTWQWYADDPTVATVTPLTYSASSSLAIVTAQNRRDAQTYINAKATVTVDTVNANSTVGDSQSARAKVRVFLCVNPWPPVVNLVTWPWSDAAGNCSILGNPPICNDTGFEFYYCRDKASDSTADDLPVILEPPVVRGQFPNNLEKEFFFLRQDLPNILAASSSVSANPLPPGQAVQVSWTQVIVNPFPDSYKIYYGTSPGVYNNYISYPASSCVAGLCSYTINNLTNNKNYYFTVTAIDSSTGVESGYFNEIKAIPADTTPPMPITINKNPTIGDRQVSLSWVTNTVDTVGYKVYYGTSPGVYGASVDVGNVSSATITGLVNNVVYFMTVVAYDVAGNESNKAFDMLAVQPLAGGGMTYSNVLASVDFEPPAPIGGLPAGGLWAKSSQPHSSIGITAAQAFPGETQSMWLHRDPNLVYPGTCNQTLCTDPFFLRGLCSTYPSASCPGDCAWLAATSQCQFLKLDTHSPTSKIYNSGDTLGWANTNRTMWLALTYNVARLNWTPGKNYLMTFYYKGSNDNILNIQLGYSLGWQQQCQGRQGQCINGTNNGASCYQNSDCTGGGTCNNFYYVDNTNGVCRYGRTCPNNQNMCCMEAPLQTDCFQYLGSPTLPAVPAGTYNSGPYNSWNYYQAFFVYQNWMLNLRKAGRCSLANAYGRNLSCVNNADCAGMGVCNITTTCLNNPAIFCTQDSQCPGSKCNNLKNEIGMYITYSNTNNVAVGVNGTDLYIDNFMVAEGN